MTLRCFQGPLCVTAFNTPGYYLKRNIFANDVIQEYTLSQYLISAQDKGVDFRPVGLNFFHKAISICV